MVKRYSITAGKIIDVPEPKGPSMDIEKRLAAVEGGERIKALEDEIAMLRASNRQLMREKDEAQAQVSQASADLAAARQAPPTPAAAPVVNVPAPVVNVPAPVVNIEARKATEWSVEVREYDGSGRPRRITFRPTEPLNF
jgi:hypothetical protein